MIVQIPPRPPLTEYEAIAHLAPAVETLRELALQLRPRIGDRTVWMVNSTAQGGGVAEMLPTVVSILNELGVRTRWFVIESDEEPFFRLTKQLHNMIHGADHVALQENGHRRLYEGVNALNARALARHLKDDDILVVHDPQPMPLAGMLASQRSLRTVWRCHIGLDESNEATREAWSFLEPYGDDYDRAVFSAEEYIPDFLKDRASLIFPAIDPLSNKNRELSLHGVVGVLANAALAVGPGPVVQPSFPHIAHRLQADGAWLPAVLPEDIGLLIRPIVTQISRWDRLKGWLPLLEGFTRLKRRLYRNDGEPDRPSEERRRLDLVRLVLAGPDPASIQDDPEGLEVVEEMRAHYVSLDPIIQDDIAVIALPMQFPEQNALMVNALQRASTIIVQNSLREGFGLTVTEGMWKRIPLLTNNRAVGPRQQVRQDLDGCLIDDPEDPEAIAEALDVMLNDRQARAAWGRNAQRRAHEEFLVFAQVASWLELLAEL